MKRAPRRVEGPPPGATRSAEAAAASDSCDLRKVGRDRVRGEMCRSTDADFSGILAAHWVRLCELRGFNLTQPFAKLNEDLNQAVS